MTGLILASASPRRRALLCALGCAFQIAPAAIDETLPANAEAAAAVRSLAKRKAATIAVACPGRPVLAADTLVAAGGQPLGKPADGREARTMLARMRSSAHSVLTGVCLLAEDTAFEAVVATRVRMRDYTDAEIDATIARGTPFDKAGGYAIQDAEFAPVAAFDGCYCNVMGLPLWTVRRFLEESSLFGALRRPDERLRACQTCPLRPEAALGDR